MTDIYDPYEVGWVAGILDGEGSILIVPTNYQRKDGTRTKGARVMMSVCDFKILEKFTTILSKWGIAYGHSLQHYAPKQHYNAWHDKVLIQVWKADSVVKLLDIVGPHLTLKQGVAKLVRDFAQWRSTNRTRIGHGVVLNPEILMEEERRWQEYRTVYQGKARSHSRPLSETIRENSTPLRWQD